MNYETKTNCEKLQLQQARNLEQTKKEEAILKEALLEITKKDYGRIILRFLKDVCLWDTTDENIDKDILAYKKGRRDIWAILRSFIPKDILAEIEIFDKYGMR